MLLNVVLTTNIEQGCNWFGGIVIKSIALECLVDNPVFHATNSNKNMAAQSMKFLWGDTFEPRISALETLRGSLQFVPGHC